MDPLQQIAGGFKNSVSFLLLKLLLGKATVINCYDLYDGTWSTEVSIFTGRLFQPSIVRLVFIFLHIFHSKSEQT